MEDDNLNKTDDEYASGLTGCFITLIVIIAAAFAGALFLFT